MSSRYSGMATFGRNQALYVTELLAAFGLIGEEACEIWPTPAGRQADSPQTRAMLPHGRFKGTVGREREDIESQGQ